MYSIIQTLVSCGRDPARPLPLRRGFLLIPLILVCFAFLSQMQAAPAAPDVSPAPDGCYPNFNTAEGCLALNGISSGSGNTGVGWRTLSVGNTANYNTALGAGALVLNTNDSNTATGAVAMLLNVTGTQNCAYGTDTMVFNGQFGHSGANFNDGFGAFALFNNLDGYTNNAFGNHALFENQHGAGNTAVGDLALQDNDSNINTAVGAQALLANTDGDSNNAVGYSALENNTTGTQNNAMGVYALLNNTGAANTAVGDSAFMTGVNGAFNTVIGWHAGGFDGSDNIYVGATSGPTANENGAIRIGDPGFITGCWIAGISGATATGGVPVVVNAGGKLGTVPAGSPLSMNNLLKQQQLVQQLKATTEKQAATIALQEAQIKSLTAGLREQATQIQKVSAQLEMIKPAPQVVENR